MNKENYIASTVLRFYASHLISQVFVSDQIIEVGTLRWHIPVVLVNTNVCCRQSTQHFIQECQENTDPVINQEV